MKKMNLIKSTTLLWTMAIGILVFMSSCNKDNESEVITVQLDDVAEIVAFSIANRTYGAVNNLNYVANNVLQLVDCNESESMTRTVSESSSDGEIQVMYNISEIYSKTCESTATINYSFNADQTLTSHRLNLDQDINGAWTIYGLDAETMELTYNGTYSRGGLWTYNLDENHSDNIAFSSTLNELKADMNNNIITAGIGVFKIEGTSSIHPAYTYEGSIEFQGNNLSTITFMSGEQYQLNLETGEITKT